MDRDQCRDLVVFTDGSVRGNGRRDAIGGIGVFWGDDHPLNISETLTATTFGIPVTNNLAELYAISRALATAAKHFTEPGITYRVHVYTDSKYAWNILTSWANTWARAGWRKSDGGTVKNLDLIREIHDQCQQMHVVAHHCNSHRRAPEDTTSREYLVWYGNSCADRLANTR
jgi:ribonuclease HI